MKGMRSSMAYVDGKYGNARNEMPVEASAQCIPMPLTKQGKLNHLRVIQRIPVNFMTALWPVLIVSFVRE